MTAWNWPPTKARPAAHETPAKGRRTPRMTETRHLAHALRNPLLWLAILISVVLAAAAYQLPFTYTLEMGSPDVAPYLTNFYPPQEAEGRAARWSAAYSYITLQGTGGNRPLRVTIEYNPRRSGIADPPP